MEGRIGFLEMITGKKEIPIRQYGPLQLAIRDGVTKPPCRREGDKTTKRWLFVCVVLVRQLLSSMAVLYHVNY